jgi:hypothetical protein
MIYKTVNFLFITLFVLMSCRKDNYNPDKINGQEYKYAFMVAGHTYGNALTYQEGLHKPFKNHFDYINEYPKLDFNIFTGDVVPNPTIFYWNAALNAIQGLEDTTYIAAGNHDRGPIFDSLFVPYQDFTHQNDLFIILSTLDWNIEGDQKIFLENTLQNHKNQVGNIFIFMHELIWWSPTNKFANVKINYLENYPGSSNYWGEIEPILSELNNSVYLFAGDLGATEVVTPYMYHKDENITYIASGMGGNKKDNMIIIEVDSSGELNFKLIGLNREYPYQLDNLTEYTLP